MSFLKTYYIKIENKKYPFLFFFVFFIINPVFPQGNTIKPAFTELSFNIEAFSRKMYEYDDRYNPQLKKFTDGNMSFHSYVLKTKLFNNQAVHIGGGLGVATIKTHNFGLENYNQKYDPGLIWSLEIDADIYTMEFFILNMKYEIAHSYCSGWENFSAELENRDTCLILKWPLLPFVWYTGLEYSFSILDYIHPYSISERKGGFESASEWGVLLGGDWFIINNLLLKLELHLLTQTGINISISWRF